LLARAGEIEGHGLTNRARISFFGMHSGPLLFLFSLILLLPFPAFGAPPPSEEPVSFNEYRPWLTEYHGPKKAKGVIYFMHGRLLPGTAKEDFYAAPYILRSLSLQGWDIISAKTWRNRPLKKFDPRIGDYLKEKVAKLRSEGYPRVIMGGQTWGAWSVLAAEKYTGLDADALLLFSPAAFGGKTDKEAPNPHFIKNQTHLINLLKAVQHPIALILFDKDEYDPGGRNELAAQQLATNPSPHLFINSPAGFTGSFAGILPIFDYLYGTCIEDFLSSPKTTSCPSPDLPQVSEACIKRIERAIDSPEMATCMRIAMQTCPDQAGLPSPLPEIVACRSPNTSERGACTSQFTTLLKTVCTGQDSGQIDFRSTLNILQLLGQRMLTIPTPEHFTGKTFILYDQNSGGGIRAVTFKSNTEAMIHTASTESVVLWSVTQGQLCLSTECQVIRPWDDKHYLGFNTKDGSVASWWIEK
jgi:hypothetical protein